MQKMRERFKQFNWFISLIKAGKTPIIVAPDYVVISWKTWIEMKKVESSKQTIFVDELSELSDDDWSDFEKILHGTHEQNKQN